MLLLFMIDTTELANIYADTMWAELLTSTYLNIETSPRQAIVLIMSRSKRYHYQCRSAGIAAHSHSSDSTSLEKNTSSFILWIKSSSVIHSFISSTYPVNHHSRIYVDLWHQPVYGFMLAGFFYASVPIWCAHSVFWLWSALTWKTQMVAINV